MRTGEDAPLLSRTNSEPPNSNTNNVRANGIRPSTTVIFDGEGTPKVVPLLNRIFGGGASMRSSALLRKRSMRQRTPNTYDSNSTEAIEDAEPSEGLKKVLNELEENEKVSTRYILFGIFCIFNHFAGGVISMMVLEGWTVANATYFCVVTLTTVGYGDLSPTTALSKIFVIYYVTMSIAIVSSYLAYFVGLLIDKQEELLLRRMMSGSNSSSTASLLTNTDMLESSDYGGLMYSVSLLIFVIIFGSLIFAHLEQFTVLDALYATVISATTVGFGDLTPKHESTKLCMTIWLVFSTIAVAKVVADFTEARIKAKQRALTRRVLTATLDRESLTQLDDNRDGHVEWGEFLGAMLVSCGKISREELDTFRYRFNQLDTDGDCVIDVRTGC